MSSARLIKQTSHTDGFAGLSASGAGAECMDRGFPSMYDGSLLIAGRIELEEPNEEREHLHRLGQALLVHRQLDGDVRQIRVHIFVGRGRDG